MSEQLIESLKRAADTINGEFDFTAPGYADLFAKAAAKIQNLTEHNAGLKEALKEAVELIKQWHNMDTAGLLSKEEHELTWSIYCNNAPEMKSIMRLIAVEQPS